MTVVALLPAAGLLAGSPAPATAQGTQAAFTVYGVGDGLSQASVNALLQDSTGFLWVGTQDGLNRFDGIGFRSYRTRSDDPGTLSDDHVVSLALADSGRIWVGGLQGGLQRFDPLTETATSWPLTELGPWRVDEAGDASSERVGRQVAHILVRQQGDLLLRTDVGLVRFRPSTGEATTLVPAEDPSATHVTALGNGRDGTAIVGLSDGSWARVRPDGTLERAGPVLPDSATEVSATAGGLVTVTFDGRIYEFDLGHASYREVGRLPRDADPAPLTRDLLVGPDGALWIATQVGAFTVDLRSGEVTAAGTAAGARGLPDPEVSALLVDRTGVLWIGTWNGLASLHPLASHIGRRLTGEDIEAAGVIAMAEARRGGLWLGTYGGGLQLLQRGADGAVVRPPSTAALAGADVFGLSAGPGDTLWVAAYTSGLWRLVGDAPAERITTVGPGGAEVAATAYSVLRDHAGDVWAGTLELGLLRLDRAGNRFMPYRGGDPQWDLGSAWIWPLAEDSRGRLWVGANNGGVSMVSADREKARLYRAGPGGLSGDGILTVYVDSHDRVWVGTQGDGLDRLDPRTGAITSWTADDGLPHDHVEGVVEDAHGMIWVTTNDGLARLDPASGEILSFHESAGLAGNRFFANGAHRGADGTLYFGGPDGLTILDPDVIAAEGSPPRAALTAFRIQGREVPLARAERTDELVLEPDENFFAFEFAAMDFADVSQNRYRYRLEGLDPDWVDAGSTPVANYTSVPPDRYVFRVAARNSEGVWNDDALVLPVHVLAPYWATWWFRSLVLVAVLSLVVGFYSYRLRQLEARQRLRLEIAGKLHDDIGANLSNIALKADMVRSTAPLDERRAAILGDVGRLARDTAHKVRETVWVVNTRYDTLPKLVAHMHDTADTLLSGHVDYAFDDPAECPDVPVSMEFRQNVYLLFKEAVNNVVKHAGAERVDIAVTVDPRTLGFRVRDDGVGFDPSAAVAGNGQDLMRRRAEAARGSLEVTSAPGEGTTVTFSGRMR